MRCALTRRRGCRRSDGCTSRCSPRRSGCVRPGRRRRSGGCGTGDRGGVVGTSRRVHAGGRGWAGYRQGVPRKTPAPERRRSASGRSGAATRTGAGGGATSTRRSGPGTSAGAKRSTAGTARRGSSGTVKRGAPGTTKRGAAGAAKQGTTRNRAGGTRPGSRQQQPRRRPRDERAAVFRRRRLVVGLLALVVVAAVAFGAVRGVPLLLDRFGPLSAEPSAEPTEEATGPDEEALANPVECVPGAVSLDLGLAATEVDAGSQVEVPVTLTNTGQVPCLLDVGHAALQVQVTSGDDTVWTTAQCPAGKAERPILLAAGGVEETTVTWSGRRSAADCPDDTRDARAGTYRIEVSIAVDGDEVTQRHTLTLT